MDLRFDGASSLDRPEVSKVPDFGPFHVNSILTPEYLKVFRLKYQIWAKFRLEVAIPVERIALPRQGWVNLFKESLKAGFKLPFHYLVIELLTTYRVSPCSIAPNSWH